MRSRMAGRGRTGWSAGRSGVAGGRSLGRGRGGEEAPALTSGFQSADDISRLGSHTAGPSTANSRKLPDPVRETVLGMSSVEAARESIEQSMAGALKEAKVHRSAVLSVCVATSGIRHHLDVQSYKEWIRNIFPEVVEIVVRNKALVTLASVCAKQIGCVLVAGTGTIALGVDESGNVAQASGWGPLLGDQGSGFAIASQAMAAVMQAHDGRGPQTSLTEAILRNLQLTSAEDLIHWMHADKTWARVAALAPVVRACACAGDTVASNLLKSAVSELARSVQAVVNLLSLAGKDGRGSFTFVMVGGLLESADSSDIRDSLLAKVMDMFPGARPVIPKLEPAIGAAFMAWNHFLRALKKIKASDLEAREPSTSLRLAACPPTNLQAGETS